MSYHHLPPAKRASVIARANLSYNGVKLSLVLVPGLSVATIFQAEALAQLKYFEALGYKVRIK